MPPSPPVVNRLGNPVHPRVAPHTCGVAPAAGSFVGVFPAAPGSDPDPPTSPFPGSRSSHLGHPVAALGNRDFDSAVVPGLTANSAA